MWESQAVARERAGTVTSEENSKTLRRRPLWWGISRHAEIVLQTGVLWRTWPDYKLYTRAFHTRRLRHIFFHWSSVGKSMLSTRFRDRTSCCLCILQWWLWQVSSSCAVGYSRSLFRSNSMEQVINRWRETSYRERHHHIFQTFVGSIAKSHGSGCTIDAIAVDNAGQKLYFGTEKTELARRFVWAGRLTKKHAFKVLELKSVLCGQSIHLHENSLYLKKTHEDFLSSNNNIIIIVI